MYSIFLTQFDGPILGPIAKLLGYIMDAIFRVCDIFGIENIGLCIILFTIVVNLLMLPLTINQQKFSKMNSVMNPELQAIQEKYKGKRDQESMAKQQAEQRALYDKYGVSPSTGCLPLIIQLPILFALYRVIYAIPGYVTGVKNAFMSIVNLVIDEPDFTSKILVFAESHNLADYDYSGVTTESLNRIVDLMYQFVQSDWEAFLEAFPNIASQAEDLISKVVHMNMFLGLNLSSTPGFRPTLAWIIPILAGLTQWFSARLMSGDQQNTYNPDNPMSSSMRTMNMIMPIFSVVICISLPIGVGLYWVASSATRLVLQIFINARMKKLDVDEMVKKNIEKKNKKRAKKGMPPIKDNANVNTRVSTIEKKNAGTGKPNDKKKDPAKTPVKNIDSSKLYEEKGTKSGGIAAKAKMGSGVVEEKEAKPGSIASKARMVKDYNEKNKKK